MASFLGAEVLIASYGIDTGHPSRLVWLLDFTLVKEPCHGDLISRDSGMLEESTSGGGSIFLMHERAQSILAGTEWTRQALEVLIGCRSPARPFGLPPRATMLEEHELLPH